MATHTQMLYTRCVCRRHTLQSTHTIIILHIRIYVYIYNYIYIYMCVCVSVFVPCVHKDFFSGENPTVKWSIPFFKASYCVCLPFKWSLESLDACTYSFQPGNVTWTHTHTHTQRERERERERERDKKREDMQLGRPVGILCIQKSLTASSSSSLHPLHAV